MNKNDLIQKITDHTGLGKNEATKAALIEAGADFWSIYTRDELRVLVAQNRVAPLSATELKQMHQIKRTFNARIK